MACHSNAAASSRALSVPCPKCNRARCSRRRPRSISAATVGAGDRLGLCDTGMMSRRSIAAFALLALAAALMGAMLARLLGTHAVALQSGTWLPSRRPIAEFHLQDLAGE